MLSELSVLCIAFSLRLFRWDLHVVQYSSCGFCSGDFTLRILETMNMNEPGEPPQRPLRGYRKRWGSDRADATLEVDDRSEPSAPLPEESVLFADEHGSISEIEGWDLQPFDADEPYEPESPIGDQYAIQSCPKVCDPFKTEPAWGEQCIGCFKQATACDAAEASMGAPGVGSGFQDCRQMARNYFGSAIRYLFADWHWL